MFDSYCIPMNPLEVPRGYHNAEQIRHYIGLVEQTFTLPEGTLYPQKRDTWKQIREASGLSVCEIRKAAVYHLLTSTKTPKVHVAPSFELKRVSLMFIWKQAKDLADSSDEVFGYYYGMVKRIAV